MIPKQQRREEQQELDQTPRQEGLMCIGCAETYPMDVMRCIKCGGYSFESVKGGE